MIPDNWFERFDVSVVVDIFRTFTFVEIRLKEHSSVRPLIFK